MRTAQYVTRKKMRNHNNNNTLSHVQSPKDGFSNKNKAFSSGINYKFCHFDRPPPAIHTAQYSITTNFVTIVSNPLKVLSMLYRCCIDVVSMSYRCCIDVVSMSYQCQLPLHILIMTFTFTPLLFRCVKKLFVLLVLFLLLLQ